MAIEVVQKDSRLDMDELVELLKVEAKGLEIVPTVHGSGRRFILNGVDLPVLADPPPQLIFTPEGVRLVCTLLPRAAPSPDG